MMLKLTAILTAAAIAFVALVLFTAGPMANPSSKGQAPQTTTTNGHTTIIISPPGPPGPAVPPGPPGKN